MKQQFLSGSEAETISIARRFAGSLRRGDIIALVGELGTGKTQFVKGICEAFRIRTHVSSPTFVILNRYEGQDSTGGDLLLYHFDLYRVLSPEEIYDLGYEEFLYADGLSIVEWADRLGNLLPLQRHDVHLSFGRRENDRHIVIETVGMKEEGRALSGARGEKT